MARWAQLSDEFCLLELPNELSEAYLKKARSAAGMPNETMHTSSSEQADHMVQLPCLGAAPPQGSPRQLWPHQLGSRRIVLGSIGLVGRQSPLIQDLTQPAAKAVFCKHLCWGDHLHEEGLSMNASSMSRGTRGYTAAAASAPLTSRLLPLSISLGVFQCDLDDVA